MEVGNLKNEDKIQCNFVSEEYIHQIIKYGEIDIDIHKII